MENKKPFVSVIIPAYNAEKHIERCIKSLINQNYPKNKLEIIVINNNSSDSTKSILKKYSVIYKFEGIPGPSAARNKGLKIARGKYILLLDADCVATKNWILNHIKAHQMLFEEDRSYKIVGGGIAGINENYWSMCDDFGSWTNEHPKMPPKKDLFYFPTANMSFSRELIDKHHIYFDKDLKFGEDIDFCNNVKKRNYKIYFEPEAKLFHINRTTVAAFMKHAKNWAISEISLQKKGIINRLDMSNSRLIIHYSKDFLKNITKILINSLKCKRFKIMLYYPWIVLNQFVFFSECYKLITNYKKGIKYEKAL
ncbi:MAG: glycosyltransferase [Clostridiales bacterium]